MDETSSATSADVDLTVICIATPSDNANFARSKISCPPRNMPGTNKKRRKTISFNKYQKDIELWKAAKSEKNRFCAYPMIDWISLNNFHSKIGNIKQMKRSVEENGTEMLFRISCSWSSTCLYTWQKTSLAHRIDNCKHEHKQHCDIRYPTYAALSLNITVDVRNLCRLLFLSLTFYQMKKFIETRHMSYELNVFEGNVNNRNTLYMYHIP